jgi:16S rRNA (adenine1518-N6/adenine1519-N6)-dimethyltransferase
MRRRQSSTPGAADSADGAKAPGRPRRRFGQNFLIDPSATRRIVAALAPLPDETVLEIGPGRGALTEALLSVMPSILAVEIDRDLVRWLGTRFPGDRLRVVERDILDLPLDSLGTAGPLVIAGNLPYNVSKPVAMKLVLERRWVRRAALMFQREVADRLTAQPGSRAYGPLTVLCGRVYRIERLFDLPPGAFRPSPKVVSTATLWRPRDGEPLDEGLVASLRAVLGASFAHRRQTIQKNLRAALRGGEVAARSLLAAAEVDGSLRAETLPPETFVGLARAWPD